MINLLQVQYNIGFAVKKNAKNSFIMDNYLLIISNVNRLDYSRLQRTTWFEALNSEYNRPMKVFATKCTYIIDVLGLQYFFFKNVITLLSQYVSADCDRGFKLVYLLINE